jgi:ATP-dependent DNA ligase
MPNLYLRPLPAGFIPHACRHQRGSRPPAKDWLHEIKHDGFRVYRSQDRQPGEAL